MQERVEATAQWLRSIDSCLAPEIETASDYSVLRLPRPDEAGFQFRLFLYPEEFELAAHPVDGPEDVAFWHQSFERLGASSLEPVEREFRKMVLEVTSHESRIRYSRGLLFHRFTCQIHDTIGWRRIGGQVLALRGSFHGPGAGRRCEYRSPPLTPAAPQGAADDEP